MDTLGKPSYSADNCPPCTQWAKMQDGKNRPVCMECGEEIEELPAVPAGFDAVSVDHWHITLVAGVAGYKVMQKRLCRGCYRKDWKKNYPKVKLPV